MRIFLAIIGFIIGNLLGLAILALFATSTNSGMENSFIIGTVVGIIGAICGYNLQKKEK